MDEKTEDMSKKDTSKITQGDLTKAQSKESTPETPSENNEADSLSEIEATQANLRAVKENLREIIDAIVQDKSILSQAAAYWGDLNPLQRLATGAAVIAAPTVIAGFIVSFGAIIAIGSATSLAYAASGAVLDDHNRYNVNVIDRLKKGILSMADVLEVTINALDNIRQKFKEELDKFKTENQKLTENISLLTEELDSLSNQVEVFIKTEQILRSVINGFEKTIESLKNSENNQTELMQKTQKELEQVKREYNTSKSQLKEKIDEINTVKESLGLEVTKAKQVVTTLQTTVKTLAGAVINDEAQRSTFQKKLEGFLNTTESNFSEFAGKLSETEKELASVKEALATRNEEYDLLLKRQKNQIERFDKLLTQIEQEHLLPPQSSIGQLLGTTGFYKHKEGREQQETSQPTPVAVH